MKTAVADTPNTTMALLLRRNVVNKRFVRRYVSSIATACSIIGKPRRRIVGNAPQGLLQRIYGLGTGSPRRLAIDLLKDLARPPAGPKATTEKPDLPPRWQTGPQSEEGGSRGSAALEAMPHAPCTRPHLLRPNCYFMTSASVGGS